MRRRRRSSFARFPEWAALPRQSWWHSLVTSTALLHRRSSFGLDCRVYQSGTSVHGKGYISKRGNGYLRHILFNAAFVARQYNPDLKRYHEQKMREGKHYFSALCAVERKLVHLIYAVWKRGTPFVRRSLIKTSGEHSPDV